MNCSELKDKKKSMGKKNLSQTSVIMYNHSDERWQKPASISESLILCKFVYKNKKAGVPLLSAYKKVFKYGLYK